MQGNPPFKDIYTESGPIYINDNELMIRRKYFSQTFMNSYDGLVTSSSSSSTNTTIASTATSSGTPSSSNTNHSFIQSLALSSSVSSLTKAFSMFSSTTYQQQQQQQQIKANPSPASSSLTQQDTHAMNQTSSSAMNPGNKSNQQQPSSIATPGIITQQKAGMNVVYRSAGYIDNNNANNTMRIIGSSQTSSSKSTDPDVNPKMIKSTFLEGHAYELVPTSNFTILADNVSSNGNNGDNINNNDAMDHDSSQKNTEHKSDSNNNSVPNYPRYGVSSMQGWRLRMEDTHIAACPISPLFPSTCFFSIFDGHSGCEVAIMLEKLLVPVLLESEPFMKLAQRNKDVLIARKSGMQTSIQERSCEYSHDYPQHIIAGLTEGLKNFDNCIRNRSFPMLGLNEADLLHLGMHFRQEASGATVCSFFTTPSNIIVANLGDSRIVVVKNGRPSFVTRDHKPDLPDETDRIQKAGGKVRKGRINGKLSVSRGIGDMIYKDVIGLEQNKQKVSCEPEVTVLERENVQMIINACDGVWDVFDIEGAVRYVIQILKDGGNAAICAEKLVEESFRRRSMDNITAMVVLFVDTIKDDAPYNLSLHNNNNNNNGIITSAYTFNSIQVNRFNLPPTQLFTGSIPPFDEIEMDDHEFFRRLWTASWEGNVEAVYALLQLGASTNMRNEVPRQKNYKLHNADNIFPSYPNGMEAMGDDLDAPTASQIFAHEQVVKSMSQEMWLMKFASDYYVKMRKKQDSLRRASSANETSLPTSSSKVFNWRYSKSMSSTTIQSGEHGSVQTMKEEQEDMSMAIDSTTSKSPPKTIDYTTQQFASPKSTTAMSQRGSTDLLFDEYANKPNRVYEIHDGLTPLMAACIKGRVEVASLLIQRGAIVNIASSFGLTPLMCAARIGNESLVKLLLNHDANLYFPNKGDGQSNHQYTTVFSMAEAGGHDNILKLLVHSNPNQNKKSPGKLS